MLAVGSVRRRADGRKRRGDEEKARVGVVGPGKPEVGQPDIDRFEVEHPDLPGRP